MALRFPFKNSPSSFSDLQEDPISNSDFSDAINLFTSQRKKAGISLEALSKSTKISRNVLIAIENGWKKYLPETTYLISMVKSLENELNLERGSLNGLLAQKVSNINISRFKFNFINIDILNSWVGNLLYLIFMLLSILTLNSQQKYLIKTNTISTDPILLEESEINKVNLINNKQKQ